MKKSLTKSEEVQILKDFVASLPEASYLFSALSPYVEEFEFGITSDIVPSVRESLDARLEAHREAVIERQELERQKKIARETAQQISLWTSAVSSIKDAVAEGSRTLSAASGGLDQAISELRSSTKNLASRGT